MTIRREDLENGQVDFGDVITGRKLPPVHPGEILHEDFLVPLGMSVYELANAIKVPRSRLNDVVRGRRSVTADTAMRIARYFGMSASFWINLQARYDLEQAERTIRRTVEREVTPRASGTVQP
jgi:addiction module HigA family antidote